MMMMMMMMIIITIITIIIIINNKSVVPCNTKVTLFCIMNILFSNFGCYCSERENAISDDVAGE